MEGEFFRFDVMKKIVLLILLAAVTFSASGKIDKYSLRQISYRDGLSQSSVTGFATDSCASLWVGTRYGLNRIVNGRVFSYYDKSERDYPDYDNTNVNRRYTLRGNYVRSLFTDHLGSVVAVTEKGAQRYSRRYDGFSWILRGDVNTGCAWDSLTVLSSASGLEAYYDNPHKCVLIDSTFAGKYVKGLHPLSDRELLVITRDDGLFIYDKEDGVRIFNDVVGRGAPVAASCIWQDRVFVAYYYHGIAVFDFKGKLISFLNDNVGFHCEAVQDMQPNGKYVWLATDGDGVLRLDPHTYEITPALELPQMRGFYVQTSSFTRLFFDPSRHLALAGTVKNGVYAVEDLKIKSITGHGEGSPWGPDNDYVSCICPEGDGRHFWLGMDYGGVDRFDAVSGTFTHYPASRGRKIVSIAKDGASRLILSVYGEGLMSFDKSSGRLSAFKLPDAGENTNLRRSGIFSRLSSIGDNVYIGDRNLYVYNCSSGRFLDYTADDTTSLSAFRVFHEGSHSYAMSYNALFEVNGTSLRLLYNVPGERINAAEYYAGKIWVGRNDGLFAYDLGNGSFSQVESPMFRRVTALCADEFGRLWMAADSRLLSYDVTKNEFRFAGRSEGFYRNELLSIVNDPSCGVIVGGGPDGVVVIDKDIILREDVSPKVVLSWLDIDGNGILVNPKVHLFRLPNGYGSLTLHMMYAVTSPFELYRFRYHFKGPEDRVIEESSPDIVVNKLAPGRYDVSVSTCLKDGHYSSEQYLCTFIVQKPLFQRAWFIIMAVLAVVMIGYAVYWYLVTSIRNKRKLNVSSLKRQYAVRQSKMLTGIGYDLRTILALAYAPLKRMASGRQKLSMESVKGSMAQLRKVMVELDAAFDTHAVVQSLDQLELSKNDLRRCVRDCVEQYRTEALGEKGASILFSSKVDLSVTRMVFDYKKVESVVRTLLANAVDRVSVGGTIRVGITFDEDMVKVSFEDDGLPMPEDCFVDRPEGDHQFSPSDISRIGLSRAYSFVAMHGGTMSVHNDPSGGSVIDFSLSARLTETMRSILEAAVPERHLTNVDEKNEIRVDTSSLTALLVDSDDDFLSELKKDLDPLFHKVLVAHDGNEALVILNDNPSAVDIVVTEAVMEPMDGFELLNKIKNSPAIKSIPVIVATALCEEEYITRSYRLGADSFVPKPYDTDVLVIVIKNTIYNRRLAAGVRVRNGAKVRGESSPVAFREQLDARIKELYKDKELSRISMAESMNLSESLFYNRFRVAFRNMTFSDYVNAYRCRKVAELLSNTDLLMSDIADECGFSSAPYMTKVFLRIMRMTPFEYRQTSRARRKK